MNKFKFMQKCARDTFRTKYFEKRSKKSFILVELHFPYGRNTRLCFIYFGDARLVFILIGGRVRHGIACLIQSTNLTKKINF